MADEPGALTRWFRRAVLGRRWLCFVVLGLSFFAFGVGTVNLFRLLGANVSLIAEHGWQAVVDGGAQQLAALVATGYLSMMAWVIFKACEHRLVHWLNGPTPEAAHAAPPQGGVTGGPAKPDPR